VNPSSKMAMMMRSAQQAIRGTNAVRAFSSHWENLVKLVPKSNQQEMASQQMLIAKRQAKADAVKPVADIDWDAYTKILGADAVAPLKAEFESSPIPNADAEVEAAVAAASAKMAGLKETVAEIVDGANALAANASAKLEVLERSRTDLDTTTEDVLRRHPAVYTKIMTNLENEDFDIDFPALDLPAMRLATIKENWDSSKYGPLNEASLAEVTTEMDALKEGGNDVSFNRAKYADFSDVAKDNLQKLHEVAGVELNAELIAEYDALADPSVLTPAEKATTEDAALVEMMAYHSEMVHDDAYLLKAQALLKHYQALERRGELVKNPVAMEKVSQKHFTHKMPEAMDLAEFEGKTAEELEALSDQAEARGDQYQAIMYLYESAVQRGKIDPTARGNSDSGDVNYIMQMIENVRDMHEKKYVPKWTGLDR